MADRVVGTGSFGVVFQVCDSGLCLVIMLNLGHFSIIICSELDNNIVLFGQAKCIETSKTVAIKKVLQDKRYKNRELEIMQLLNHPNVVQLYHHFFSTTEKDELYLNLVLEYVSETVNRMSKHYIRMNQHMPLIYVRLYSYQVYNSSLCHLRVILLPSFCLFRDLLILSFHSF